jgi:hypothetical protein
MAGSIDTARALAAESEDALSDFGQPLLIALGCADVARVELLAQKPGAAVRSLRRSYETLESLGESGHLSTTAALLAEALLETGDDAAAEHHTVLSEEASLDEDVLSQTLWRAIRARVRGRAGDHEGARQLARAAVALAEETDDLTLAADAFDALGAVLAAAGRGEAASAYERAAALYESKGNLAALMPAADVSASAGV